MKNLLLFCLLAASLSQTACVYVSTEGGDRVERTSRPGDFSEVVIDSAFKHVQIDVCDSCSPAVNIEGDDRQVEEVEVVLDGDVLTVKKHHQVIVTNIDLTVQIRTATLQSVTNTSSSDVDVDGIDTEVFEALATGSGDTTLSGRAGVLDATTTGSGDITAYDLEVETAQISSSGSGDIGTCATGRVSGTLTGSGDLTYDCGPDDVEVRTTGSGDAGVR